MTIRSLSKRWFAEQRAAAAVEFALVATPLILVISAGLELGYVAYVKSMAQGALNDAARLAAVEDPAITSEGDTIEEQVANYITDQVDMVAVNGVTAVGQSNYADFSDIENPEKLMQDKNGNGAYDDTDGDCFEDMNENGTWDDDGGATGQGGASDVVFYEATVSVPRLLPLDRLIPSVGEVSSLVIRTAVRNQPYAAQATPPVVCGTVVP